MTVSNEKNSMDRTYDRLRTVRVRNSRETHVSMDTPARLLRLLVLFSSRASWRADELTAKLEVTERTLRRDVVRLRDLGYPIESTTGPYGGYALGAGGRLPPLLLDDDEAVAVSVGLREVSHTADPMIGAAAVSALTKLAQVLPSGLRERVDTLGEVTVGIAGPQDRWSTPTDGAPSLEVGVLMLLAEACRRGRRLRFDYTTGDDTSIRTVSYRFGGAGTSSRSTSTATTGGRSVSTGSRAPPPQARGRPIATRPTRPRSLPKVSPCARTTSAPASGSTRLVPMWPRSSGRPSG
jgi:biotin operon repressor